MGPLVNSGRIFYSETERRNRVPYYLRWQSEPNQMIELWCDASERNGS